VGWHVRARDSKYGFGYNGVPGKPPCNHAPPAAPAQQTQPYVQSYFSVPVPSQTRRGTFEDGFNQGVSYSQQHYPSNLPYGSPKSPAAFVAHQQSLPPPTFSYEGICRAFVSNMQNGAPPEATSSILDEMYNMCDDHQPST
jgi:hypothetical protein